MQTSSIVLTAISKNDAGPNRTILDLGCGTGMLGLGFAIANCSSVYLVDCDDEALETARENVEYLVEEELIGTECDGVDGEGGCLGVEIIGARVKYVRPQQQNHQQGRGGGRSGRGRGGKGGKGRGRGIMLREKLQSAPSMEDTSQSANPTNNPPSNDDDDGIPLPSKLVDTVITNPPFGTKNNEGIDVQFLRTAIRLARRAVYSFHKTSTRPYLIKLIQGWGLNVEVVAEMKFDIPNMYKFHKQKSKDVEVDLIRVFWEEEGVGAGKEELGRGNDDTTHGNVNDVDSEVEDESEGEEMPLGQCGHA